MAFITAPQAQSRLEGDTTTPNILRLWPTFIVALLAAAVISAPNLLDPMMRYDDFPALLVEPSGFWAKTLHEGRWVNYLWHLRGVVTPSWLNFAAYQMLWALFAASIAVAALGRHGSPWFCGVMAMAILVAPPATLISLWFNTLIPGLALVASYAALGCRLAPQTHRALLPIFVILSFMAYTTYPLLLLAVCLVRSQDRSLRDLLGLLALFTISFAAAVLVVYTLNLQVHGVFGVPLADWRDASPAQDIDGMLANLPLVWTSFSDLMVRSSFGFAPAIVFHLGFLVVATFVVLRRAPLEALYLHAGLWVGMGLAVVQILKMGAIVPPRGFIFAWVFYAIVISRAAQILSQNVGMSGRMARNGVLLIVGSYLLQTFQQYSTYRAWQSDSRAIAQVASTIEGAVFVLGDPLKMVSAKGAFVQDARALSYRIQQISGKDAIMCGDDPSTCQARTDANTIMLQTR
ncbi:MAG: hypothetical protein ABJL99_06895 [Aliishimia sp.]